MSQGSCCPSPFLGGNSGERSSEELSHLGNIYGVKASGGEGSQRLLQPRRLALDLHSLRSGDFLSFGGQGLLGTILNTHTLPTPLPPVPDCQFRGSERVLAQFELTGTPHSLSVAAFPL